MLSPRSGWITVAPPSEASMSVTTGSSSHSASMYCSASSACARVSAITAATASPAQQARPKAIACCGGDLMPWRWASTAVHGLQVLGDSAAIEAADHARLARGGREIELLHPRVRMGTAKENDVGKTRKPQIVHIGPPSLQQPLRVGTRLAPADVSVISGHERPPCGARRERPRLRRRWLRTRCSGSNCRKGARGSPRALPAGASPPDHARR